jgi:NAD(P)-dependent dehydrogenase (short-subunit alcohol dehydrogenase family)
MSSSPTKKYHKTTYPALDPTRPELSAKGKSILVTGGGTGIGAETAKYFAKAGASRITLLGRREQPLLDTKAEIEAAFPDTKVLAIPTDLTKEDQVKAAFDQAGTVDVLISNAAVLGNKGAVASLTPSALLSGITANLLINVNVTTSFLPHAPASGGVIVEVNSAAAHLDIAPDFTTYNVAKMATARFFQCVQFEHPELCVYSIQPGAVETDMSRAAGYKPASKDEEFAWKGEGADVLSGFDDKSLPASFMVWLACPEARFLKGKFLWANWDVDELVERKGEIEGTPFLSLGMQGWPFVEQ